MSKRAAIYARFSTDLQNGRSIDDQHALNRELCARHGWPIVKTYSDHSVSGSTVHRADFARMIADASAGAFDILVANDIDRLARGEGDAPQLRRQLEFMGVEIHTCADGHVTKMHAGLKGLMSSMFLDNLVAHTKRGLAGVVRSGRHPGGRAYGYRAVPGKPGELAIVADEAAVLRRIFSAYVAGSSPREIATRLNADGIAPPRGRAWRASTINGNLKRGHGILQNELYAGFIVWNRVRMVRDPNTGRRVSRPNPASQHQRVDAPHLRIIDRDLFAQATARKALRAHLSPRERIRPKRMLSGLVRCGRCGGGMSVFDTAKRPRLRCSGLYEGAICDHRRAYYLDEIERRLLRGLRDKLGSRAAVAHFVKVYNDEKRRSSAAAIASRASIEKRLTAATREIDRTVDLVVRQIISDAEAQSRLPDLRAERDRLTAELAAIAETPKVISLHPAAVETYLQDIDRLDEIVAADLKDGDEGVAQVVRRLIETVTVMPAAKPRQPDLQVTGRLPGLLEASTAVKSHSLAGRVVAGARFGLSRHLDAPRFKFVLRAFMAA